ncbi:MAG: metallophosphoesterase family protein [Bacteroidales bacterium]|nr:metallophosphoesterase family protein [Bacteroidales bacterium]
MYIGLISDTHGTFSEPFREFLAPVDVIWHAGDWGGGEDFVKSISDFKPAVGVYGNCDGYDIRYLYPEYQLLKVQGLSILMTHIGGSPGHYYPQARKLIAQFKPDVFICGHSHILKVMNDDEYGFLYLNPGAAGLQGWQLVRTALRFKIEDGQIKNMEVFEYPKNSSTFADRF